MMQEHVQTQQIPFAGQWSPFREAGQCPVCGAWVKMGRTGRVMPPIEKSRVRYLCCDSCGERFKATETDPTV